MSFRTRLPLSVKVIAAGRGISFLGDEVALLAMVFKAKAELGHFGVAAVLMAGLGPLLLLSPFSGLLVDRVRTRPLLVVVGAVQAATCVALAWSNSATLIPLIALLGVGTAIAQPAWQALVPGLVDDEQLPGAMGLLQGATSLAGIAGPFVGGLLVGAFAFHVPLLVDAASFVALAAVPVLLGVDRRPRREAAGGERHAALAGFALIGRSSALRAILVLATLFVLSLGVVNVVEVFFVTAQLHAGPLGYGLLGMCLAAGVLVASAGSGWLARRVPAAGRLFVVGAVGLCVGIGAFGLTDALWQAACILFVTGVANGVLNVSANVIMVRNAPPDVRGRVFAAVQGTISAAQIGALGLGGLLFFAFTPRSIILAGAAGCALLLTTTVAPVLRSDRTSASPNASPEHQPAEALA